MPLPQDDRIIALANDLLHQFQQIFGSHPGFRPAHAKGVMLTGEFRPARGAEYLTRAPHALRPSTPVTVRFSNSTGLPEIPDSAPEASPRGLAVRFNLAEHVHTDIVSHSTDGFPARDGAQFLEFLKAVAASGPDVPSPKPIELYLGLHSAALAFVQTPKPFPSSFARETYFGVTAYAFTSTSNQKKFGRYRILPESGNEFMSDDQASKTGRDYLFDEIKRRVTKGPVRFKIVVQVAEPGDVTDDATVHWPETRQLVNFGTMELTHVVPDNEAEQQHIIFDPIPRVDGIDPSADPLLELRAAAYLLSGRQRRAAKAVVFSR